MRTFISGGVKFCFMERGEKLGNIHEDKYFTEFYVIWPRNSGKWDVRWFRGDWKEITDLQYDTENEAFQCAHEHHLAQA